VAGPTQEALVGQWVHSHEEDSGGEAVYRPASHSLPPSRGRTSFELRADGTYLECSPGPVDAPEQSSGRWSLDGDRLTLEPADDRPLQGWQVTEAGADRLVLRRI
jgi:hypothetical protein